VNFPTFEVLNLIKKDICFVAFYVYIACFGIIGQQLIETASRIQRMVD